MPNRIIREGILSSEKIATLNWAEEVFYRRLQSIVDDYGRYEANPQLLRSKCYPLQTDSVKPAHITAWLSACVKAGLIVAYAVDGKTYLEVLNFGQQVRAKSKFPAPTLITDSKCLQVIGNEHLGVSVFGVVSEDVGVAPAKPDLSTPKKKKTQLPKDFSVSERVAAWAKEHGYGQLDQHLDAFKRKATAKGYTYVSWDDAFMEAIREDWAKLRQRQGFQQPHADPSDPDSRASIEAEGIAKGIGPWDDTKEHWHQYKARVRPPAKVLTLDQLQKLAPKKEAA